MSRTIKKVAAPKLPKRRQPQLVSANDRQCRRERNAILEAFGKPLDDLDIDAIHRRMLARKRLVSMVEYRSSRGTEWREGKVRP